MVLMLQVNLIKFRKLEKWNNFIYVHSFDNAIPNQSLN